jgi:Fe-S-cluster-containing hydrogenase component 2
MTSITPKAPRDLLRWPVIGALLRQKRGRLWLQVPMLALAALLVYDGFTGPALASRNLATVGAWVHYRGLVIVTLLLAGNLFCMGCPFTLPRTLAKRLAGRGRRFPKILRNKWLAIVSLFLLFYLYEWLDLWASPALTAWVIVAYFVASFVLEFAFAESAFCKYVCPLGTFNFTYSMAAPLQVAAKDADLCKTCVGKECLNGSYSPTPLILIDEIKDGAVVRSHQHNKQGVLGCGTELFVPQMKSNWECTLCLDCARACPHDNVALQIKAPNRAFRRDDVLPKRWDVSFLLVMLAFIGLSNAFGMIPPVYVLLENVAASTGIRAEWALLLILFLLGNVLLPASLSLAAAWLSAKLGKTNQPLRETYARFAPAFIPIGLGVWAAHYGFHFAIGALTIVPVFQNFLLDIGVGVLGQPNWTLGGLSPEQFAPVQVLLVLGGYLASMIISRNVAMRAYGKGKNGKPTPQRAQWGWLPYALLFLLMMLFAFWVFQQPMEMRGTNLLG